MTSSPEQLNPTEPAPLPLCGVLVGIDYGTKRVGVSVSDRDQKFSSPLHNYQRQGEQPDARFFRKLVEEYRPIGFVVGLPLHLSGDESEKSKEARKYAAWLTQLTGLPHNFRTNASALSTPRRCCRMPSCRSKNAKTASTNWPLRFCCSRSLIAERIPRCESQSDRRKPLMERQVQAIC